MNITNQVKNLLEFTAIFLSGDLKLKLESTDYYREKYDKYIGIPLKKHTEQSDTYKEWSKIWGENEDINTIMLYLIGIVEESRNFSFRFEKHWLVKIPPETLLNVFEKYIGDSHKIKDTRYNNIHPVIKKQIYEEYIQENIRYFKFLRILKK